MVSLMLPPAKMFETAVNAAVAKSSFSVEKTFMLSVLAGIQIGFGALLLTVVAGGSPALAAANPGLHKFLAGAVGLPTGLSLVVLTGGELFTGNVFVMIAGLLSKRVTVAALATNWSVSFVGNFVGSLLAAALAVGAKTVTAGPMLAASMGIAATKVSFPFWVAFCKGLLCNWLVCSAVFLAMGSQQLSGKVLSIFMCVSAFVAMGYEHSVANMFLIPHGMMNGASVTVGQLLMDNIVPVTLGNIVGGGALVAFAYWFAYGEGRK